MIFRVKVVYKKDDFLLPLSFIIFHVFFQNLIYIYIYESRLYRRQLSRVFSNLTKKKKKII
jgi:hypothetical protein